MDNVHLVGGLDVAELTVYAFFAFFLGLVIYLRREDRREGYPLEDDLSGRLYPVDSPIQVATPKTFRMPHGLPDVTTPTRDREAPVPANAARTSPFSGSPLVPIGDPLAAGVGPGAWAARADRPDLDFEGHPRIVPIGSTHGVTILAGDRDPRGLAVVGADGSTAGTVSDLWVDKADHLIRYLAVSLANGAGTVLVPMTMAKVQPGRNRVVVSAVTAAQFAGAPRLAADQQITLLEEEKIVAYFGAGYLYATPDRAEPLI
ncbi:photosynthetic reaction center subunit H [Sandaracinobacteroides saxicola]|uniref:Photosynthetic reaction center subunit H n=1 Tax=Sandaracinobacteroides saxicola TaxID=2759707 RepID=A0A7G5IKT8_9SPHN|nr:photosynthetic reaction center subunit H [Sandaracinobacteroides saxicola]QMW23980.1 photosynthetic reaction center subunit H [Sandaracinobacteroides saxicola]